MTVKELYINSNDAQIFILFELGGTKPCFKGYLDYCPIELIDRLVYQFRAIDFNTIEVEAYNNIAKTYPNFDDKCFIMSEYNYGNTLTTMNKFSID